MSTDTKPRVKAILASAIVNAKACSFCDKTQKEVRRLIAREGGFPLICDECIGVRNELLAASGGPAPTP